jgi:BlaI family transcriptional regulator, penicillinase repressor
MMQPRGTLTSDQLEIMHTLWSADKPLTAAEVWQEVARGKDVARTTVITLLKRLGSRGWLHQEGDGRGATYFPTCAEDDTTVRMSHDFLNRFFDGSPSRFVMNLLGSRTVSAEEAAALRKLLEEYEAPANDN